MAALRQMPSVQQRLAYAYPLCSSHMYNSSYYYSDSLRSTEWDKRSARHCVLCVFTIYPPRVFHSEDWCLVEMLASTASTFRTAQRSTFSLLSSKEKSLNGFKSIVNLVSTLQTIAGYQPKGTIREIDRKVQWTLLRLAATRRSSLPRSHRKRPLLQDPSICH